MSLHVVNRRGGFHPRRRRRSKLSRNVLLVREVEKKRLESKPTPSSRRFRDPCEDSISVPFKRRCDNTQQTFCRVLCNSSSAPGVRLSLSLKPIRPPPRRRRPFLPQTYGGRDCRYLQNGVGRSIDVTPQARDYVPALTPPLTCNLASASGSGKLVPNACSRSVARR